MVVFLTRWISPNPRPAADTRPAAAEAAPAGHGPAEELAIAA
jgi:hypothetical protein